MLQREGARNQKTGGVTPPVERQKMLKSEQVSIAAALTATAALMMNHSVFSKKVKKRKVKRIAAALATAVVVMTKTSPLNCFRRRSHYNLDPSENYAFNILNHAWWSNPSASMSSTSGLITTAANSPRILQVAMKVVF